MSSIIFLGTGGCGPVMHSQQRATGGIILQNAGEQVHVDPGPGALLRKREHGINLKDTTAVLVSNSGVEHNNDVNAIINAASAGLESPKCKLLAAKEVVNPGSGLMEKCKEWLKKIHPMTSGDLVKLGGLNIQALPTKHEQEGAVGFKMFTDDFVLSYSSDTEYSKTVAQSYGGSDILILNVTQPSLKEQKNNLNSEDAKKIIEYIKPKLAVITHFGQEMLFANPLYEAREIQRATGVQTIAAYDGMKIDPRSYSAVSPQKSLVNF